MAVQFIEYRNSPIPNYVILIYICPMKNFWAWAAKSFQDKDGNTSSKRTTAFAITVLYMALNVWYAIEIKDKEYRLYQIILNCLLLLLLLGVILWQNIIELRQLIPRFGGGGKNDDPKPEEK